MTKKKSIELSTKYPIDQHTMGFIRNLVEKIPTDSAEEVLQEFLSAYEVAVDINYKSLRLISSGPERASYAMHLVDDAIREFMSKFTKRTDVKCQCKKGCNHCCHTRVEVCGSEADLLVERILRDNILIDWDRLARQAGKHADDYYERILGESNRCVFLDDEGCCKVYDIRPLACREHLAAGEPSRCSMKGEETTNNYIYIHSSRVISNALMFLEMETVGDMATNLLKRKSKICQDT